MSHIFVGTTGHTMETKGRLQNVREMGAWPDKERDRKKKGQLNNVQVTL